MLVDVRVDGASELVLNAKDLTVASASFGGVGDATAIALDEAKSTLTLRFAAPLPRGRGELRVAFAGVLNNQMCGFYRSTYTDRAGAEKLMASTQFESVDARRCFPCWDEPSRKATFTCSLRVPTHMTALSNMPEALSRDEGDGTKTVAFMESPKMSTYLLAFVVGEFDHVSALTQNGVLIRAFCPPGKPHLGRFALRCAVAALDEYDRTFEIPYPLPKSDMVAIPEFAAGAMENWGLVTYREVDMLVDEAGASSRQLQRVAEVVIHELAHQWFGNLVTMAWWDDLWLNEGFATWMETGVCARLHPEWSMWEQFIQDMQGRALDLDALRSSHPIQVPIGDADEVEQVFDAISYCKGGAVVRMVHEVVGDDAFVRGLRAYMREFAYGNAQTDDLWAAWEKASAKPVTEMMSQWTKQLGFPLLTLARVDGAGTGELTLSLEQSWYLADGSAVTPEEARKRWMIPVFASASGGGERAMAIFPAAAPAAGAPFTMKVRGDGAWVKLNARQPCPLRVKYPDDMVPALARAVAAKALPPIDRIGVLSDHAALAKAGKLDPTLYLEVLGAYADEDDATVLGMLIEKLVGLHGILQGAPGLLAPFDAFARKLLLPRLDEIGWEPRAADAHLTRKLRGELIAALPHFAKGDAAVLAEATRRFDAFVGGAPELPSEYQQPVFKLVLAEGGEAEYAKILALFRTRPLNEEKKAALIGLGAAPTPALRTTALEFAMSDEVKLQDFFYLALSMQGSSPDGGEATWAFFREHVARYEEKLKDAGSSLMDAVIVGAARSFATREKAAEVRAFFDGHPMPRSERKIAQIVEGIEINAKYLETLTASGALAWLEKHNAA